MEGNKVWILQKKCRLTCVGFHCAQSSCGRLSCHALTRLCSSWSELNILIYYILSYILHYIVGKYRGQVVLSNDLLKVQFANDVGSESGEMKHRFQKSAINKLFPKRTLPLITPNIPRDFRANGFHLKKIMLSQEQELCILFFLFKIFLHV